MGVASFSNEDPLQLVELLPQDVIVPHQHDLLTNHGLLLHCPGLA